MEPSATYRALFDYDPASMSPNKFASRDELKFKVNYERLSCSVILNCNSHVFFSKNHRIESVENLEVSFQYLKKANSITQ